MRPQPTGTVTMLFSDIEGSTRLLERLGAERYAQALARHRELMRAAFARHSGYEVDCEGDAFFVAFGSASGALRAAAEAQAALAAERWPEREPIRVRMGVHTGEPMPAPPKYVGMDVHKAARIMSAGHGGQVLVSETTAALVEPGDDLSLLDLGEHRLKDLTLGVRLYQLCAQGLEREFPALKTLASVPHNLPVQATPFLGREREVGELRTLVVDGRARLVTLTGPGGIGKTRLALQVAAESIDAFRDGVFAVSLAALRDPGLIAPTVLAALGVRERPDEDPVSTLAAHLESRRALLLLDNLEQLLPAAAPIVAELLRVAEPTIVVTSRAPLRLSGEQEYPVAPLAQSEALVFFVERARFVRPDFVLDGDGAAVEEICERLDRLPLALELAAARVKVLPPRALLQRLDQRLKMLTGGAHDLPERQRTLRGAIAWSHELLTEDDQTLFRRLAVFVGGCGFEAAEQVCDPEGELDVLEGLASLVDKSLVRQREDAGGEPRFSMLQTVREFALERLREAGEADDAARRHAEYFLRLGDSMPGELHAGDLRPLLERVEREHDDIRVALRWLDERNDDRVMTLVGILSEHWYWHGHFTEAAAWTPRALAAAERALTPGVVRALRGLSIIETAQGDYERARAIQERLAAHFQATGEQLDYAEALSNLGVIAVFEGASERAVGLYERALELAGRGGSQYATTLFTANLAEAKLAAGAHAEAAALAHEAAGGARALDLAYLLDFALHVESLAKLAEGDVEAAVRLSHEALRTALASDDKLVVLWALDGLSAAVARSGNHGRAARLAGGAAAMHAALSAQRKPHEEEIRQDTLGILEDALEPSVLRAEWSRGEAAVSATGALVDPNVFSSGLGST